MEQEVVSYAEWFFQGFGQFTGVVLGVLAGTFVTLAVHAWKAHHDEKQQLSNFKFELEMNAKKLDRWLDDIRTYRDAVNGDSLAHYFEYFKLSSFIGVMALQLHNSGRLYKHLSHDLIDQLQQVYDELSMKGEIVLNNQVAQRKKEAAAAAGPGQWPKQDTILEINFWERKFKSHLQSVRDARDALS